LPPDQRLCPWTPLGALPPDPHYRLVLRTRHGAPQPLTPSASMSPTELCPGTSNRKSAPMAGMLTPLSVYCASVGLCLSSAISSPPSLYRLDVWEPLRSPTGSGLIGLLFLAVDSYLKLPCSILTLLLFIFTARRTCIARYNYDRLLQAGV